MPPNTTGAVMRMRSVILYLIITWLAFASLSSLAAVFANVLRDLGKSDIVHPNSAILYITLQPLAANVLEGNFGCGPHLRLMFHSRDCPVVYLR